MIEDELAKRTQVLKQLSKPYESFESGFYYSLCKIFSNYMVHFHTTYTSESVKHLILVIDKTTLESTEYTMEEFEVWYKKTVV